MSTAHVFEFPRVTDVRSVADAHAALLRAFGGGHDLGFDLSGVEAADGPRPQLRFAAPRRAAEHPLALTLTAPAPAPVMHMLERGGFIGAAPDERRDFWLAA